MDLITMNWEKKIRAEGPLAMRVRPEKLEQFIGQEKILAKGKPLRKIIESDRIVSMIFYGPPGSGKTSLAQVIASSTKAEFVRLNAVAAGVKDVRLVIDEARDNWSLHNRRTILFIDEIHRFNKAQQDVLLSAVEQGTILFIGATTENPFFYLTGPLLSRTGLYTFEALQESDLVELLKLALSDKKRGLGSFKVDIKPEVMSYLADKADGDARAALNALELAVLASAEENGIITVTIEDAAEAMQRRLLSYDRGGDNHYDLASALIKSIRGSDPDAALYWMARMLAGGEDPLFIARRLIISASEDIGNADPLALNVAVSAAHAVQMVGLPEGRITLAQAVTYLASAPKSNASYLAISEALALVEAEQNDPVPVHLRDSSYRGAKRLGHGKGYIYPHDYPGHHVEQDYLPAALGGRRFYRPTGQGREEEIVRNLEKLRSQGIKEEGSETKHEE